MRHHDEKELKRWYKKLWDFAPDDDSERDVRFGIAFALAQLHDNYQTAAHVLTDIAVNTTDVTELIVLRTSENEITDACAMGLCATEKQFRERFDHLYNIEHEGD